MKEVCEEKSTLFIEIGAGSTLTSIIKQDSDTQLGKGFVNLLHPVEEEVNDLVYFNQMLGLIWSEGIEIDWSALKGDLIRKRLPLPTYVFDKKYHENDIVPDTFGLMKNDKGVDSTLRKQENEFSSMELSHEERVISQLKAIWHELLGCDEVQPEDDFFTLGGHSLKAISLASLIQKVFDVEISLTEIFGVSTFGKMADWLLSSVHHETFHSIQPVKKSSHYEASSAQKRLYAVNEMIGNSVPYNLASVYIVEGTVDKGKFKKVIDELVRRHDSFRTRFTMIDGEVIQIVEDDVPSVLEFGTSTESELEIEVKNCLRPFELSKAPLFRVKLISINEEKHVLFIDMHHIISDQSSIAVLLNEFTELYKGKDLPPLSIQYKDFAAWQNELFRSGKIESQLKYWKNEFKGEIPVLNMLTDYKRPQIQAFKGDCVKFEFGTELSEQIDEFVKEHGLTSYMVMISALKLVLWKYTGQNDLVVGTGIAGRRHADLDSIVGMFVNTLAIRSQIDESLTVAEYLQYMKKKMIKAYENQDCQFEMLVELLDIEKDLSRNPLFDIVINYINMGTEELSMEGLSLNPWTVEEIDSKFDITWTIQKKDNGYYADIEYSTSLFKRGSMKLLGDRLLIMVSLITSKTEQKLSEISILKPNEKEWLLYELNKTATDFPRNKTISQLFEEQVQKYADKTALIWDNEEISYIELNQQANQLAELLAEHNVKHGNKVAILLDRDPMQIVSILAILKSGCTYVPIDPEYPDSRINFILEDSESCLLLTHSQLVSRISKTIPYVLLDIEAEVLKKNCATAISSKCQPKNTSAEDIAYIIYTSGSTGTPKGTLISHRNVVRVVRETNYINILPTDRFLQLSNYAFDGSVFDIFGALINGASLVIIPRDAVIEIPQLAKFIKQKAVTSFFITAALFNMLVDWDVTSLKNTRKVLVGGEELSMPHISKALEYLGPNRLINGYGPTETTVFAVCYPINKIEDNTQSIPIGYPISNTTLYILDKQGQPVPPNVPGELYIGGDGVGKGYLNSYELTQQKFLDNKFDGTGKVYRTGDLVWRMTTGEIGFIGRLDFQIKIRGFRVELGEIENHIKNIPGVKDVVVISRKDNTGSLYIAAYYTVDRLSGMEPAEIREFLDDKIQNYMIPARMKKMESLPLNINGKIDRKSLPVIEETRDASSGFVAPRNQAEQIILEKMQRVLDNPNIGIKDDFFRSGGQSIKAIALVQVLSKMGIKIKVNEVFQHPTVEELAALPELNHLQQGFDGLKASVREAELLVCTVNLNEQQTDSLAEHVQNTCNMISRMIASANRSSQFPLSPVQKAHVEFGSNISGFTTWINGDIDEKSVRRLFISIIEKNQLLHSICGGDGAQVWNEFDISVISTLLSKNIPYLDLLEFDGQTKELVVKKLCSSILLSPYIKGYLPWRLCCLRYGKDKHYIIWGFDHIAFDAMSAEVIRHQIEKEVSMIVSGKQGFDADSKKEEPPRKYQDYVSVLNAGPQGISENEMIDLFSLKGWSENNTILLENLDQIPDKGEKEIEIHIPLADTDNQNPWWMAFDFTVRLLSEYTGVSGIPIALLNYGRSYRNEDYYNCVGEFLDVIPLLIVEGEQESRISELLKQCRLKSINFLSLLFDENLAGKFVNLVELMAPAYKTAGKAKKLVLFNFQGFVSKEEKNAFKNPEVNEQNEGLSKLLVNVNYDEENLCIGIESPDGINTDFMEKIIQTYSNEYSNIVLNNQLKEAKND
ncbi:MAG: amino acid adenylation domain-containing protein [Ruminiclostridium sp.]